MCNFDGILQPKKALVLSAFHDMLKSNLPTIHFSFLYLQQQH